MNYQNIVVYLVIPLALLSITTLVENVQAQTNSTPQIVQQNQNMNLTTQALMKVNIIELKDMLMKANLAIVDGNLKEAKTAVRDVESQLLEIEPMPTKFLDNIHKAIKAIARSDIDKALNTLTQLQVTILKAENLIFKAAVANPQMVQQFDTMEPKINEEDSTDKEITSIKGEDSTDKEITSIKGEDSTDKEGVFNVEEDSTDKEVTFNVEEDSTDKEVTSGEEEDYKDKEDT
jgi:hypothetical protein